MKNIVIATGGIVPLFGAYVAWKEYDRKFGPGLQKELKKKIEESTYPERTKKPSLYITRGGLPDIMKIFAAKEKQKTVMVCGPRGSGKTAAVRESLEGKKGVLVVTLADESQMGPNIASAITEALGLHTNKQVDHTEVVVNALKKIRSNNEIGHLPVLVVEVNKRFTSSNALEELVLTLKDWGHDEGLVCPIVVLSTSRAAMGLGIGMDELRGEFACIGDLDHKEAKGYIKCLCTELEVVGASDVAAVSKCAEVVVSLLGSRLLHLDSFADGVRFMKNTSNQVTLKNLEQLAAEREQIMLKGSRRALKLFHKRFPNTHKKDLYGVFKKPGAAVDIDEFSDMVGEDVPTVVDELSKILPHPFYVDPKTQTVVVGSSFVQKVINTDHAKLQNNRWFCGL